PDLLIPTQDWAAAYDYDSAPGDSTSLSRYCAVRLWCAAEVWATTEDTSALADFESRAQALGYAFSSAPDWVDPSDLGIITYLRTNAAERSSAVVDSLSASVLGAAGALRTTHDAADNGWGRAQ